MDLRTVLSPERLPKSPIGSSLVGILGVRLAPGGFGEEDEIEVEIPMGSYVRGIIASKTDPDRAPPMDVALLSSFEPLSLYFASFFGPETPLGPELLMVLTFGDEVVIR
jgi:hypothetical protein